jgi:hypothetical protein
VTGRFSRLRVFVTYRREDSAAYAGRLHDSLVDEFGEDNVFQDVSAIDPGEDFEVAIDAALEDADAALVVIGPRWLAPGPDGTSRLQDPKDYVHIEIRKALARDIRVVPILVGGANLPLPNELPEDLVALTRRQAVQLRDTTWRDDVDGLVRRLRGESPSRSRGAKWLATALGVFVVAGLGIWALVADEDDGTSDDPPLCESPAEPDWTRIFSGSATGSVTGDGGVLDFEVTEAWYHQLAAETWEVALETVMTNEMPSDYAHDHWRYQRLIVDSFGFDGPKCFSGLQASVPPQESSRGTVGFGVSEEPTETLVLEVVLGDSSRGTVQVVLSP